jgi:hypothetical protein
LLLLLHSWILFLEEELILLMILLTMGEQLGACCDVAVVKKNLPFKYLLMLLKTKKDTY